MIKSVLLLLSANLFMTFAWYGHLKNHKGAPLLTVILVSWGIAFIEYCFQVPANRLGSQYFSLAQLKVLQEVLSLVVFAVFSVVYMQVPITRNYVLASGLLLGAAYLIFSDQG